MSFEGHVGALAHGGVLYTCLYVCSRVGVGLGGRASLFTLVRSMQTDLFVEPNLRLNSYSEDKALDTTWRVPPDRSFFSFLMSLVKSSNLTCEAWKKSCGSGRGKTLFSVPACWKQTQKPTHLKELFKQKEHIVVKFTMWLTLSKLRR